MASAATESDVGRDAASKYDAFISYSHARDRPLAVALESGLERFAKPWYRRRAMRVFRDESSLSATPGLWPTIEEALTGSRFLILVASPESARSRWVSKEIEHWLALGRRDRLLIAVSDGSVAWDEVGDFDWTHTDALPHVLRSAFADEPLYVDLRWARTVDGVSLRDPRFREPLATIAAPLHGSPRDELIGEDLRQHRRTLRLARGAVTTLAVLLLATAAATAVAFDQRSTALTERDRAEQQARIALSRQLAAEAQITGDDQLDQGLLLATQAYALEPSAPGRAGVLARVMLRSPYLVGYLPGSTDATTVTAAPQGDIFVLGDEEGQVSAWQAAGRQRLHSFQPRLPAEVTAIEFSHDGQVLIAGAADGTFGIWDYATGRQLDSESATDAVAGVALDATGERFAVVSREYVVMVGAVGGDTRTLENGSALPGAWLAFMPGEVLVAISGQGDVTTWHLTSDEPPTERRIGLGQPFESAVSPNFQLFAGVTLGNTPYVVGTTSGIDLGNIDIDVSGLTIDVTTFDRAGDTLAVAYSGRIVLWDLRLQSPQHPTLLGVPGRTTDVAFGVDDRVVVAVGERGVAVWNIDAEPAFVRRIEPSGAKRLDQIPNVVRGATSAAFSPDGRLLATTLIDLDGPEPLLVVVWDLERDREVLRFPGENVLGFSRDGMRLAAEPFQGDGPVVVADIESGETKEVTEIPWTPSTSDSGDSEAAGPWDAQNDRGLGASMPSDGTVTLWDVARNQPIADLSVYGQPDASTLAFDEAGQRLAVATAGGVVSIVDVDPESWRARACSLVGRPLTEAEQQTFIGSMDVPDACAQ